MNYLLDTCAFLWIAAEPNKLSPNAKRILENPFNMIYMSPASSWEILIKYKLKKIKISKEPEIFIPLVRKELNIETIPITEEATLYLNRLPDYHRDPFDRILICQAIINGMTILTPDPLINKYTAHTYW